MRRDYVRQVGSICLCMLCDQRESDPLPCKDINKHVKERHLKDYIKKSVELYFDRKG